MSDSALLRPDPSPDFERAFRRVHVEKMLDLPFLNPALSVEAVAFQPWRGYWLGVMLTPWSMNMVLAPREAAAWRPLPFGDKRRYNFPAGAFDFISAYVEHIGEYLACSLFSPVLEFADQDTARETARLARAALLEAACADSVQVGADASPRRGVTAPSAPADLEQTGRPITRRELLHGRFSGGSDVSRR